MHSLVYYILLLLYIIYYILSIRTTSDKVRMRQMFHVKTWRRCSAHYVYAIAKKEKGSEIDASPQLPISTGVQSLERSRLPWSVPLDRSRLPRSAIMAVQVQSTDVFLCYQRLRVSCALCNNFQAARPRQTTERRLAPLYVEHMPSLQSSRSSYYAVDGTRLYHVMYTEILFTRYCTEILIGKSTVLQG